MVDGLGDQPTLFSVDFFFCKGGWRRNREETRFHGYSCGSFVRFLCIFFSVFDVGTDEAEKKWGVWKEIENGEGYGSGDVLRESPL